MLIDILFLIFFVLASSAHATNNEDTKHSDAPSTRGFSQKSIHHQSYSYREALKRWKTARHVNYWIAQNFEYDMQRAMALASNSETRGETNIYRPDELYLYKKGTCIDLSRFAFETIQAINPTVNVKYLMINFEPLQIANRTFRRHWMVVYKKNDKLYTMADTKRPGHISGPHDDIADFIAEYEQFRKRRILSYKITNTYRKKLKNRSRKRLKE
jgi:hypothetical protein